MSAPTAPGDLGAVLAVLREHAVALAAGAGGGGTPPARVRVEAAGVVVELDWPGAGSVLVPAPAAIPAPIPVPAPAAEPALNGAATLTAPTAGHRLTAPTVGVFYRSPEPGAPPFVAEGDLVAPGQQVAIIEAMKLMIPVEADRAGRVGAVLGIDGASVEFGEPLFVLTEGS